MAKSKSCDKKTHIVKGQKGETKEAGPKGRGHIVKKGRGCCQ
jgi:hypothetical protein